MAFDEFSLGDLKSEDVSVGDVFIDEVYEKLVAQKPSYCSSYEDFYRTTTDVFKVVSLKLFQSPNESDLERIKSFCDDVSARAEKLWLRTNQDKLTSLKDALGSLAAFFNYYEKKGNGKALYSYLFDKFKFLINEKLRDGKFDSEKLENLLASGKDAGLWDEQTPELREKLKDEIIVYCKNNGWELKNENDLEEILDNSPLSVLFSYAEQGNDYAQCRLGEKFVQGDGIEKDYKKGKFWTEKAALQGNVVAQRNLGVIYSQNWVEYDAGKAFEWMQKAAVQGDGRAQYGIGIMYLDGFVPKDYKKAVEWLEKAVEHGNPTAKDRLNEALAKNTGGYYLSILDSILEDWN